jgi:hypothetical protein
MKKVCLAILSLAMALCLGMAGAVSAHAAALINDDVAIQIEIPNEVMMAFIQQTTTSLRISGGQATLAGTIIGYNGLTTRVVITLHLERRVNSSSAWSTIFSDSARTFNSFAGSHQITRAVTSGFQYRVRAVYTAFAGTRSETITAYSSIVTF